jgi:ribosomal protein S18 acetylase RimI-like enzyme
MEFTIRKARLEDAEQIGKLFLEFWMPHKKVDPLIEMKRKIALKNEIKSARKEVRKRNCHYLVAEKDGKVIGYIEALIKKNEDCFKIRKYGYLNSAAVLKRYRGKGVAKVLTKEILKFLKTKKINYVKCNVYNTNKTALKVWEKVGFKPQSTMMIKKI